MSTVYFGAHEERGITNLARRELKNAEVRRAWQSFGQFLKMQVYGWKSRAGSNEILQLCPSWIEISWYPIQPKSFLGCNGRFSKGPSLFYHWGVDHLIERNYSDGLGDSGDRSRGYHRGVFVYQGCRIVSILPYDGWGSRPPCPTSGGEWRLLQHTGGCYTDHEAWHFSGLLKDGNTSNEEVVESAKFLLKFTRDYDPKLVNVGHQ